MKDARLMPVYVYLGRHAGEPALARLGEQMEAPSAMFSRKNMTGHITASGPVVTPDHREVLLVGHLGTGKWLQPGGHVDDEDTELWKAAAREIREETGISNMSLHPWHDHHGGQPADIDTHPMPARPAKGEGDHFHHDCMFVFIAERSVIERQEEEVGAAAWCAIDDERVPERLRRVYHAVVTADRAETDNGDRLRELGET
jgi:8-oxo-dGTP pyrophosphatase MutT (NUDIX family)